MIDLCICDDILCHKLRKMQGKSVKVAYLCVEKIAYKCL